MLKRKLKNLKWICKVLFFLESLKNITVYQHCIFPEIHATPYVIIVKLVYVHITEKHQCPSELHFPFVCILAMFFTGNS